METGPATLKEQGKGRPWGSRRPLARLEGDGAEQLWGWNSNQGPTRHLGLESLQRNSGSRGKKHTWLVPTHSPKLLAAISSKISSVGMEGGGLGRSWAFASKRVRAGRSKRQRAGRGMSGAIYNPELQTRLGEAPTTARSPAPSYPLPLPPKHPECALWSNMSESLRSRGPVRQRWQPCRIHMEVITGPGNLGWGSNVQGDSLNH